MSIIQIFCLASSDSRSSGWSLPGLLCSHPGHTMIQVNTSKSVCTSRHYACDVQAPCCLTMVRMTRHNRLFVIRHQPSTPLLSPMKPHDYTFCGFSSAPADIMLRERRVLCEVRFVNGVQFPACHASARKSSTSGLF